MKIYNVYQKFNGLTPILYGYTNKKSFIKQFKNERNMKYYNIISHEITKDEYNNILRKRRDQELKEGFLNTKSINSYQCTTVSLILTYDEEIRIFTESDKIYTILSKYTDSISRTFNDKILEALDTIDYFSFYKMKYNYDPFFEGVPNIKYVIDEFHVFMHIFGELMKE